MNDELSQMSDADLWALFPIVLCEHDPAWKHAYAAEALLLRSAIGLDIVSMHHIGSTAVEDLIAKPTIDILLEIADKCDLDALTLAMGKLGYRVNVQPNSPPPHRMFLKGYTLQGFQGQCFHVHVRYLGDWAELYFRDYLMAHAQVAKEYGALKKALLPLYKHDRDAYTLQKTDFVARITALARAEYAGRYTPCSGVRTTDEPMTSTTEGNGVENCLR